MGYLEELLVKEGLSLVGKRVSRPDALDKVLGRPLFTADKLTRGMLWAKIVRSKYPHAIIKRIDKGKALGVPGVLTVLTAEDIPGENQIGYAIPDQPLLAMDKVRFVGEPVAVVVAENEEAAEKGAELVEIEYESLPAVFDPLEALKPVAPRIHESGNIATTTIIRKGDVEKGFREADVIVENTYKTQRQEHAYLETETVIAVPEINKVTILACMQSPWLIRRMVAKVLGYKQSKVRVIELPAGGAFGGKDDMIPMIAPIAALAAVKTGKPVFLMFKRDETFEASNKRHPSIIRYKSGATKDGKLVAVEIEIIYETGAYANRGPFVLWRATAHAAGPYEVPNVKVDGKLVYTNRVFSGSFRGFGDPQIHFAAESQMDELAAKLGMDPVEFRLKNILKPGLTTTCGQVVDQSVGVEEALRKLAEKINWEKRKREIEEYNRESKRKLKGIGVACAYHGISTSRGAPDWSAAAVIINEDGTITYKGGICRLGQGSLIGHAKIVAEILGVPLSYIQIEGPDTDAIPEARPTHGSRGLMTGGTAAADAASKLRRNIVRVASEMLECKTEDIEIKDALIYVKPDPSRNIPFSEAAKELYVRGYETAAYGFYRAPKRFFDPKTGLGVAYGVYVYIVNIAEVEVDTWTGQVKVERVHTAADVGKAIDPDLIEQQFHGAIAQGLGLTLTEDIVFSDGKILNNNYTDYVIPTVKDRVEVPTVVLVEQPYKGAAFGAKGVAEAALIPTPPAITNAIRHATGIRFKELPVTPEKVYFALKKRRGEKS